MFAHVDAWRGGRDWEAAADGGAERGCSRVGPKPDSRLRKIAMAHGGMAGPASSSVQAQRVTGRRDAYAWRSNRLCYRF